MKRFTTPAQRRVIKNYWQDHRPFSVFDLIEKKILRFPFLGRLTLRLMESKGQILARGSRDGKPLYIATTDSEEEWADLWDQAVYFSPAFFYHCFYVGVLNRHEKQELLDKLEKNIEEYRQRKDDRES